MTRYYIVLMGPAGSGKTTLTQALSEWLGNQGIQNTKINLDPAVEWLPYMPDVDVRDYVNARDVAIKHGLGPNGALLTSMDLLYTKINDVKKEIIDNESQYNIIDTPGQLELFAYRNTGPLILDKIVPKDNTVVVFLIDSNFTYTMESLLSLILLSYSVELRHSYPQIIALTKADLLPPEKIEFLNNLKENPEILKQALYSSPRKTSFLYENLVGSLVDMGINLIPVSSLTEEGLWNLFGEIQLSLSTEEAMETNIEE